MTTPLFDLPASPLVPVEGGKHGFPVRRIFCVGRNYAAHAAEMGNEVDREAPFYFTKSTDSLCLSGATIPYPLETRDCHYEMEFVVALGGPAFRAAPTEAMGAVWGYGCGIDLTRRDLQGQAKDKRRPWDLGKDFENAAIIGALTSKDRFGEIGDQAIRLSVDGRVAQDARLSDMVWAVPEIIAHLSRFYHLGAGDVIYTGTPAGVGPVVAGNVLRGEIDGLVPLDIIIGAAE
ncbi:fumarylacetoacetate hydrolase family protein [Roseovarius autotrophicus]|uniref:fumarylacetoacetate hydrolase family protein n=1 Tax=Roseovarius autotrophicus TaxID=2824121 RepID=UPI0019EBAEF2|nr:fumarylacetoacetate hydrolase family protein [Roseovarius autotrophicus]MBE0453648.1 fumarylacetoacetate hydrolase family protein [Roseovarius sp.]